MNNNNFVSNQFLTLHEAKINKKGVGKVKGFFTKAKENVEGAFSKSKKTAQNVHKTSENIKDITGNIKSVTGAVKGVAYVGTVGVSAIAIKMANDAYRRKRYQDCAKLSGPQLKACRLKAIDSAIRILSSYTNKCSKVKDPEKCKYKIGKAIQKMNKQKTKLLSK